MHILHEPFLNFSKNGTDKETRVRHIGPGLTPRWWCYTSGHAGRYTTGARWRSPRTQHAMAPSGKLRYQRNRPSNWPPRTAI